MASLVTHRHPFDEATPRAETDTFMDGLLMIDEHLFDRRLGRAARISYFVDEARTVDFVELEREYMALKATAPRRTSSYLERNRVSRATQSLTRSEERLAATLVTRGQPLMLPDQTLVTPIDFQVPLKAIQANSRVGKIDMLGVSDRLVPTELKTGGSRDTPLAALLEVLSYAAILEANYDRIVYDCRKWDLRPPYPRPGLLVLADSSYWQYWDFTPAATGWRSALIEFMTGVAQTIGLSTWLLALPEDWETLPPGPVQLTDALADQTGK